MVCSLHDSQHDQASADDGFGPASVYALACGCFLLPSGSLSDVVGSRTTYLSGCFMLIAFTLGCALAKTGIQLIMFRVFTGIALALCLPKATSIITSTFAVGRGRDLASGCLEASQPVGHSLVLVLNGVLTGSVEWRTGCLRCRWV